VIQAATCNPPTSAGKWTKAGKTARKSVGQARWSKDLTGTPQHEAEPGGDGKHQPVLRVLHRGQHYAVRFWHATPDPWAVVSFEYWKPDPSLDGEFAAEGFFRHRGMNAFGIMAARNDWFQDDEILEVIAAINAVAAGWKLIGYGGSMGGFAAINFFHDLHLSSVVAVIPQFSIDAAKAPYETRWQDEAAAIAFRHDKIAAIAPVTQGWAIFDPWCVDGRHMADIQRVHSLFELRVPFGGHDIMGMLQQADVYTSMFTDMLEERFDPAAFRRRWRVARRRSARFWLGLSAALLARGNAAGALRAALQASALAPPEPGWAVLAEADARAALGERGTARALLTGLVENPVFGVMAAERLARWAEPPPASPRPRWRRIAGRLRRMLTRRLR